MKRNRSIKKEEKDFNKVLKSLGRGAKDDSDPWLG